LKRISQNRDLFEASANETITVTVEASNTPYQVTFSALESGGQGTSLQSPTPANYVEYRQFTMPAASRELFTIVYAFPPNGQIDPNAKYRITLAGAGGTSDGPNNVFPPVSGDIDDLPYEFRLPGAAVPNFAPAAQSTVQSTAAPVAAVRPTAPPSEKSRPQRQEHKNK